MRHRHFRKLLISLVLIVSMLLSLTGCSVSYRQRLSPARMRRTVARIDGQRVRYELFRALFYQFKSSVDGGDDSLWEGEGAKEAWDRVLPMIEDTLKAIYATFSHAESVGINPYSRAVEQQILSYVEEEISMTVISDKDATGNKKLRLQKKQYLDNLERAHFTDAASRILYRYSIVSSLLSSYYQDTFAGGELRADKASVAAFFNSVDCIHLAWIRIEKNPGVTDEQMRSRAEQARAQLLECTDYEGVKQVLIAYSPTSTPGEIEHGLYLSPVATSHSYDALITEARGLSHLEVGEIVETYDAYNIPVGLSKDPAALDNGSVLGTVTELYLEHQLYQSIDTIAASMTIEYTRAFQKYRDAYGSNID